MVMILLLQIFSKFLTGHAWPLHDPPHDQHQSPIIGTGVVAILYQLETRRALPYQENTSSVESRTWLYGHTGDGAMPDHGPDHGCSEHAKRREVIVRDHEYVHG